ncbi:hypothetical protein ACFTUC_33740 [Streptomyces sp. NPDC056944]|uniref:hypothetical protein n=1 Tax=Streptomyces sp. NPDC056944 TaxID=3345972 RepID=UPI003636F901
MSASDQDTPTAEAPETDQPRATGKAPGTPDSPAPEGEEKPSEPEGEEESGTPAGEEESSESEGEGEASESEGEEEPSESDEESSESEGESSDSAGALTPKQARRLRVAAASVLLVAMAVVLVIRLASRTSVLVVGVYGLAMILCGIVIELSRNGRTRLGTWLLVGGLLAALALDWLVLP